LIGIPHDESRRMRYHKGHLHNHFNEQFWYQCRRLPTNLHHKNELYYTAEQFTVSEARIVTNIAMVAQIQSHWSWQRKRCVSLVSRQWTNIWTIIEKWTTLGRVFFSQCKILGTATVRSL
jgi:hypothetical protein